MIRFSSDYTEGAHPSILSALAETNFEQNPGYSEDTHCAHAAELIRNACNCPQAAVHFLVGGTQANTIVIASLLKPFQGALCADSGHIHVHETGAVEATGHKVLALPGRNGKITVAQIREACESHAHNASFEHIVHPGLVYISHPTEYGTLYTLQELTELSETCRKYGLPLFLDGARLGYGLAAEDTDVTLQDIARLCNVFYIGGTKVGALFGEAVVITDPALQKDFRYMMKRGGGMLAKGWLLGLQFDVLMDQDRYVSIARHAVEQALRIKAAFEAKGCRFLIESWTNQQFPILDNETRHKFDGKFAYSVWEPIDADHTAVRFCTSWATKKEDVDELIAFIHAAC